MSVRAALRGASHVVGIDIEPALVGFANGVVRERYPELGDRVSFVSGDVADLGETFGLIISKDTMEHVADPTTTLGHLRERLSERGELWVGFSKLYYSPWGDHGRLHTRLPWLHALPWPVVRRIASRARRAAIHDLADVGLNGMTPEQFRKAAAAAGLEFVSIQYNRGDKRLLAVLARLRRIPWLERFATVSVYAVLTSGDEQRIA